MQQLVVLKKIKKYICEEEILGNKVSSLQLQASFCIFHIETTIFYRSCLYQKSFREPYISKGPNFKSEFMHVHFITLPSCTTIFLKQIAFYPKGFTTIYKQFSSVFILFNKVTVL